MASFNKVFLMGNLTRDPELRYTPNGTAVVNLRLAVNRKYKDRNQEMKEEVCFLTAVVWNKQAETCNQYLRKGSGLFVEGRLQSRSWEDAATGKQRSVIEVRAERVQFLGGGSAAAKSGPADIAEEPSQDASADAEWLEESEEKVHEDQ
ncbi:MAG TPA: single-stranded DNA-binding protein [Candidatus Omnitrophota bacterium]|nr:single-stranded DNA-binding protein [Candidatus Omnitrophota bacterium]HRZ15737.1 single-stranded DNA-binding protein [Candidatus Omnitrophota bacterium]